MGGAGLAHRTMGGAGLAHQVKEFNDKDAGTGTSVLCGRTKDGAMRFAVRNGVKLLADHFPSAPIVPASLLLEFIGSGVIPEAVRFRDVRFHKPIVPDEVYSCEYRASSSGQTFAITRAGELCVRGVLDRTSTT
jgi:3-hydroxymyristoyl/3-hydroxydecanoyl-(acyl carrier protein) dehydratase